MDIFLPQNFFALSDILTSVLTGAVAAAGLLIALKTYVIAREAKDEWKKQKDMDYYMRFARLFPISKEYIEHLRFPISSTSEIKKEFIESFRYYEYLDEYQLNVHREELIIKSRKIAYDQYMLEFKTLYFESILHLEGEHPIAKYLKFVLDTENKILTSAHELSISRGAMDFEDEIEEEGRKLSKQKRRNLRKIIFSRDNDEISREHQVLYDSCNEYLRTVQQMNNPRRSAHGIATY